MPPLRGSSLNAPTEASLVMVMCVPDQRSTLAADMVIEELVTSPICTQEQNVAGQHSP